MTDIQPMFKGSFSRVVDSVTNDMISSLRPKNIFAINTNKLTLKVVANKVKKLLTIKTEALCLSEYKYNSYTILLVFSNAVCAIICDRRYIKEATDIFPSQKKVDTAIYMDKADVKYRVESDRYYLGRYKNTKAFLKVNQRTNIAFSLYDIPVYTYEINNANINIRNLI